MEETEKKYFNGITVNEYLIENLNEDIDDILNKNLNMAMTLKDIYTLLQKEHPDKYIYQYNRFYSNNIFQILNKKDVSNIKKNNKNRYICISDTNIENSNNNNNDNDDNTNDISNKNNSNYLFELTTIFTLTIIGFINTIGYSSFDMKNMFHGT
jgi:hypothetical protein